MHEYEYEYIFLQCTQVRVLWKVHFEFLFKVGKHSKTYFARKECLSKCILKVKLLYGQRQQFLGSV